MDTYVGRLMYTYIVYQSGCLWDKQCMPAFKINCLPCVILINCVKWDPNSWQAFTKSIIELKHWPKHTYKLKCASAAERYTLGPAFYRYSLYRRLKSTRLQTSTSRTIKRPSILYDDVGWRVHSLLNSQRCVVISSPYMCLFMCVRVYVCVFMWVYMSVSVCLWMLVSIEV